VEIIKADLTSSLEHVEVIKDTECKRCARLLRGRRKPPNAPKLDTRGDNAFPAIAVLDADSCDASNIKKRELDRERWHCAALSLTMAELIGGTKVKQRDHSEELPRPFLKRWLEDSREKAVYLTRMLCRTSDWCASTTHD